MTAPLSRELQALVLKYAPVGRKVAAAAYRRCEGRIPLEDLQQAALLGQLKAARRWTPERGSFATYSRTWAYQEAQELLRQHEHLPLLDGVEEAYADPAPPQVKKAAAGAAAAGTPPGSKQWSAADSLLVRHGKVPLREVEKAISQYGPRRVQAAEARYVQHHDAGKPIGTPTPYFWALVRDKATPAVLCSDCYGQLDVTLDSKVGDRVQCRGCSRDSELTSDLETGVPTGATPVGTYISPEF